MWLNVTIQQYYGGGYNSCVMQEYLVLHVTTYMFQLLLILLGMKLQPETVLILLCGKSHVSYI